MATNFHPDLPNDQLHPPKDFSVSNNSSVLTKSDAGLLDWNTSPYGTETRITCGPDIAGGLHERKFYVFLDESNKGECYFDVAGETDTHVPLPGYHQIKIDIAANDSAITIASEIQQEFDRQTGSWGKLTTTVDGTGKVTFNGMTDSPDTVDGDTNFEFVNTKTYTGTTVLTSTSGVIEWLPGGGGSGTVTAVTGTAPIVSSGGTTPAISITQANSTTDGYLSSSDYITFSNGVFTHTPIRAFASNLGTGLWIKNMQDTHAYKFSLAPRASRFSLTEAMGGACYYYRQGETFEGFRGFISGTAGQQVDIIAFSVSTLCNTTHTDNNTALGNDLVTLAGDRDATCFGISPAAGPFPTDGMIVIAVNIPGRDNVSFQIQSRLTTF
jgi:hypothetical protein